LIFCDGDRIPAPDFVERHATFHRDQKNAAAFGCSWDCFLGAEKLHAAELGQFAQISRFSRQPVYYRAITTLFSNGESRSPAAWAAFLVGNSSVRKTDFEKAGGFDENFRSWGLEHFDLALRLLRENVRIVNLPEAANFHIPHAREEDFFKKHIRSGSRQLAEKHSSVNQLALEKFLSGEISVKEFERSVTSATADLATSYSHQNHQ
jgi:GT2 family glycosyltransferase